MGPSDATTEVESYMDYQASKFVRVYDANCYLKLSKAMDLQDLGLAAGGGTGGAGGAAGGVGDAGLLGDPSGGADLTAGLRRIGSARADGASNPFQTSSPLPPREL